MPELERELEEALRAVSSEPAKQPCGCGGTAETDALQDIFSTEQLAQGGDLAAQLEAALSGLVESGDPFAGQALSVDELLAFADLEAGPQLTLTDLLGLVEQYPGLKITFSY